VIRSVFPVCAVVLLATLCLEARTTHADEATRYIVVVTGSEILAGAFPDGHTHFLAQTLRPLGLRCVGSMTVDDGEDDIRTALEYSTNQAGLVIVTGGLGPTDNDVTCEAISKFTGIAAKEHPDVLAIVARRFRTPIEHLQANVRRQTRVPIGGSYLQNTKGSAVGLVFETAKGVIVALPGPPRELRPMVEDQLIPYLSRRFGTRLPGSSLTVRFVGLGQSSIDQRMKQHVTLPDNVTVSSQFEGGRVDFTFSLPDANGKNRQRLEKLKQSILEEFCENVYATDGETSLEDVVIAMVKERNLRLVLAEIASGGNVGAAFSRAEDSDEVLAGAYVAPDLESLYRLVGVADNARAESPHVARIGELAKTLSARDTRRCSLVVGPQVMGGSGTEVADVVICMPDGRTTISRTSVRGDDAEGRARVTTRIVDTLRKEILER